MVIAKPEWFKKRNRKGFWSYELPWQGTIYMFVDSTKEANSAITIVLVFATFILFTPLFIKASYFEAILNFIPTVLMVKLASTPVLNFKTLLYTVPTALISMILFLITVRYFRHVLKFRQRHDVLGICLFHYNFSEGFSSFENFFIL